MQVYLDGRDIHTRDELHDALYKGLKLPKWYGRNLDALSDFLTTCHRDIELVLFGQAKLEESLGRYAFVFERVLSICSDENPHFKVTFEAPVRLLDEDDE